jgi:hypothetical protein
MDGSVRSSGVVAICPSTVAHPRVAGPTRAHRGPGIAPLLHELDAPAQRLCASVRQRAPTRNHGLERSRKCHEGVIRLTGARRVRRGNADRLVAAPPRAQSSRPAAPRRASFPRWPPRTGAITPRGGTRVQLLRPGARSHNPGCQQVSASCFSRARWHHRQAHAAGGAHHSHLSRAARHARLSADRPSRRTRSHRPREPPPSLWAWFGGREPHRRSPRARQLHVGLEEASLSDLSPL